MKRIYLLLIVLVATALSCKREEAPQTIEYIMENVTADPSYTTCTITCKNDGIDDSSIHAKLLLALNGDLRDAESFPMRLIDGKLTYQLSELKKGTLYYYGFEVFTMADVYRFKEVYSFKTLASTELRVITSEITNVGQTSATGGGSVIGGEDMVVSERGICWSTNHNPTIGGEHLSNGYGLGEFEVNMTELAPETRYYVRAYASSSQGTVYGNEVSFTTIATDLPELTTEMVTFITYNSALGRGIVVSEGTAPVTERGLCWSTNHNPTINDSFSDSGQGTGVFTVNITDLTPNTTYYVRAYAVNALGTSYGNEESFTTNAPVGWPDGMLPGVFSVSNTLKVKFSQGNLQYQASTDTWRFASNQYDYMGNDNWYISQYYNGWIDLFGWGTSGWNSGNVFYQPWDATYDYSYENYCSYGPIGEHNLTGYYANADWGVYNQISNGGNTSHTWRTLSQSEWIYMFNTRNTSSGIRYVKAQVNNVNGVILLPDDWNTGVYGLNYANDGYASFSSNVINTLQWVTLENAGAVFLPSSGFRTGHEVYSVGTKGYYWSTTAYEEHSACLLYFLESNVQLGPEWDLLPIRPNGCSVRLVKNF